MRTIKYRPRYGTGVNSAAWQDVPLDQFILNVAALCHVEGFVIPPLRLLNETLLEAKSEHGGGYEWKPFTIEEDEYQELVEVLCTDPRLNVVTDSEFDDAKNAWKWRMALVKKYGGRN